MSQSADSSALSRTLFWLGTLFFFVAAGFCAYYFQERNLGDAGWRLYYMANLEQFCPSHKRWVLMLVQILPLTAISLKLGLKTVMIWHSISPVLLFYGLFCYATFRLKDRAAALSVVLLYSFGIREIFFYWPDLEMQLQCGFIAVLAVYLQPKFIPDILPA